MVITEAPLYRLPSEAQLHALAEAAADAISHDRNLLLEELT